MSIVDLIAKKRDGGIFSTSEIHQLIAFVCDPTVPDFQISAMLMAIYLKGMTEREVADLTLAMAHSGDTLDFDAMGDLWSTNIVQEELVTRLRWC